MLRFATLILLLVMFHGEVVADTTSPPPTDHNRVKRLLILHIDSTTMAWNTSGTLIITASRGAVRVWDAETLEQRYFVRHSGGLNGIEFNASEDRFLTWTYSEIRVWEVATGRLLGSLAAPGGGRFEGVAWHGDDVLNWFGGTVALWDGSDTGNLTAVVVPGESFTPFRANVSWNQARTHFLTWNAIGVEIPIVRVWAITGQLEGITQIMTLRHEDERIDGAAWSPDETMILSWSQNMVKVWDVASADAVDLLHVLNTDSYITAADWSPNSRYVLVRDIRQNAMRIWDARAGEEALTIPGTAMWDTSGDRLLVGRQTVTLLDVATGATLAEFGPSLGLGHAYWNPDGVRLLARTAFGIQVWIIPSPDRCVVHALAPVNLRAEPSTESARVDVLPIRRLLPVIGQAVGADDFIWWQVADDLWVRSDVVEATGYCPSDD